MNNKQKKQNGWNSQPIHVTHQRLQSRVMTDGEKKMWKLVVLSIKHTKSTHEDWTFLKLNTGYYKIKIH
jgi:hypothetical protein